MNQRLAIAQLREAISQPPMTVDGVDEPGWCCVEQAAILSKALTLLEIDHRCCGGEMACSSPRMRDCHIARHHFILLPAYGILDSSVTFDGVVGLSTDFGIDHDGVVTTIHESGDFIKTHLATSRARPNKTVFSYFIHATGPAHLDQPNWRFKSPFESKLFEDFPELSVRAPWDRAAMMIVSALIGNLDILSRRAFWLSAASLDSKNLSHAQSLLYK